MTKKNKDAGKVTVIEKDNSCCEVGWILFIVLTLGICIYFYYNNKTEEEETLLHRFSTVCEGNIEYTEDRQEVRCEFNRFSFYFPFTKDGVLQAINIDKLNTVIKHIDNHGER